MWRERWNKQCLIHHTHHACMYGTHLLDILWIGYITLHHLGTLEESTIQSLSFWRGHLGNIPDERNRVEALADRFSYHGLANVASGTGNHVGCFHGHDATTRRERRYGRQRQHHECCNHLHILYMLYINNF